jgi:hypothetical protein
VPWHTLALSPVTQAWSAVVPAWATEGGLSATVLIGRVAGLYPAIRAARLAPIEALALAVTAIHVQFARQIERNALAELMTRRALVI